MCDLGEGVWCSRGRMCDLGEGSVVFRREDV